MKQILLPCLLTVLFVADAYPQGLPSEGREPQWMVPETFYRTYSAAHAIFRRIKPGERVRTRTLDSGGQDEFGAQRASSGNPLTGPFYVEGAEPGDALIIAIEKLSPNRSWGYTAYRITLVALSPESIEGLYPERYKENLVCEGCWDLVPWGIDLERARVKLKEPVSRVMPLEFPIRPMIGSIGVAPRGDYAPAAVLAGPYGGNMDYPEVREGARLLLPVFHEGAFLYIGDAHALQGEGELIGGVETSMNIQFTVSLRKSANLTNPRIETENHLITIGSQTGFTSSLDHSLRMATSDMVNWLVEDYDLEVWAAHMLIGAQSQYEIATVAGSVALKVPKQYLPRKPAPQPEETPNHALQPTRPGPP